MHGYYWNWGHGPFWGGGPFMIVFGIAIIFFVASLLSSLFKGKSQPETAPDILMKRYATREISKEEFALMKKDI